MGLTQTAAQQATTISTAKTNVDSLAQQIAAADGPDRARLLAERDFEQRKLHQARESKTVG